MGSTAKLCEMCLKLDTHILTYHLQPCRSPLPCSDPPVPGTDFTLGSITEIKSRRSVCDICRHIADSLDKEPPDLDGVCRFRQSAQFCSFQLPSNVKAQDPAISHFHLTQATVIFDTCEADQFQGPSLPWELRKKDTRSSHYILNFQVSSRLRLTRLVLSGQIKVKARSSLGHGNLFATSPQTERDFLATIGGRDVSTQANAQLIRAWLHQCETEHGKGCMTPPQLTAGEDKEPTFVVDVVQSCLVDTPSRCRYVALSYVWGTAPVFTHLKEYTQDLRKASSLRSLPIPSTIKDAITLVHAIGERYLWVDSLCITQNDWKMQEAEIMRMGSIYSRALFTIIAAAGGNANSGLAGVERGTREQVQKVLKIADSELLTVIDVRRTSCGIDDTTWTQRAWTFQERVLSNRVLVFSGDQVYWNCRTVSYSEERALEGVRNINRLHLSFPQKKAHDSLSWQPLQPLEYCDLYNGLLSSYRKRRLTYQTDILNAFNGVSEILAALQNDNFLWGLPESLFSYAMTWFFTGHSIPNHVCIPFEHDGSKDIIPIPSWSWAAWCYQDPDNPPHLHAGYNTHVRPVIQFDIVDKTNQLVRVTERTWVDHTVDRARALREGQQTHKLQSPPRPASLRPGQLLFWTSFANVRAIRRWAAGGPDEVQYVLFPSLDFRLEPHSGYYRSEIVHQDFIVIATDGPKWLVLLAIEWKDGVAYRVGRATVQESEWVRAENRQWRLIVLG